MFVPFRCAVSLGKNRGVINVFSLSLVLTCWRQEGMKFLVLCLVISILGLGDAGKLLKYDFYIHVFEQMQWMTVLLIVNHLPQGPSEEDVFCQVDTEERWYINGCHTQEVDFCRVKLSWAHFTSSWDPWQLYGCEDLLILSVISYSILLIKYGVKWFFS